MNKNKAIKLLGNLLMIASLIYIGKVLINTNFDFSMILKTNNWIVIFIGAICYSLTINVSAKIYFYMLKHFVSDKVISSNVCNLYLKSNLYKYLPGNVFHYIARNQIAADESVSALKVTFVTFLEIGLQIITVLFISLLFSFNELKAQVQSIFSTINQSWLIPAIIFLTIIIAAIGIIVYRNKFSGKIKSFRQNDFIFLVKTILLYSLCFTIYGLIYFFILKNLNVVIPNHYIMPIVGLYSVSWLIGFITPGAPGGIGIREVIMLALLSQFASEEKILAAGIINRIVSIAGDLFAYLSFTIFIKLQRKNSSFEKKA